MGTFKCANFAGLMAPGALVNTDLGETGENRWSQNIPFREQISLPAKAKIPVLGGMGEE